MAIGDTIFSGVKKLAVLPFKGVKFFSDKAGFVATASGLLLLPFFGVGANKVFLSNPKASFLQLMGAFWQPLVTDPKSSFAINSDMIVDPSSLSTGSEGVLAGIKGVWNGWCHLGHAFMRDVYGPYINPVAQDAAQYALEASQEATEGTMEKAAEESASALMDSGVENIADSSVTPAVHDAVLDTVTGEVSHNAVSNLALGALSTTADTAFMPGTGFVVLKSAKAAYKLQKLFRKLSGDSFPAPLENAGLESANEAFFEPEALVA